MNFIRKGPAAHQTEAHFRKRLVDAARDYLLAAGQPEVSVREPLSDGVTIDIIITPNAHCGAPIPGEAFP